MHACPLCSFQTDDAAAMFEHLADRYAGTVIGQYGKDAPGHKGSGAQNFAKALGLSYQSGYGDATGEFEVAGLKVKLLPTTPVTTKGGYTFKSSKHRTYVICPTCNRSIPTGRIEQHLIVHRAKNKVCEVCGKTYGTGNHLRTHMRQVHGAPMSGRFGVE